MGPRSAEVVDRIRELGWQGVLGNTDELLWRPEEQARQRDRAPALTMLLRWLFESYAPDTSERLGETRLAWLREQPTELWIDAIAVVHAAPGDLWQAPMPDAHDQEFEAAYGPLRAGAVVYGHIHRPFTGTVTGMAIAKDRPRAPGCRGMGTIAPHTSWSMTDRPRQRIPGAPNGLGQSWRGPHQASRHHHWSGRAVVRS